MFVLDAAQVAQVAAQAQDVAVPADCHLYVLLLEDPALFEELSALSAALAHMPQERFLPMCCGAFWVVPRGSTVESPFGNKALGDRRYKSRLTSRNVNTWHKVLQAMEKTVDTSPRAERTLPGKRGASSMKMKDVCEQTGLTEKAVRFYVERGLVQPRSQWRNGRTYYEFSPQDVERLRDIACLRQAGFAIEALQQMARHPECTGALAQEHIQTLAREQEQTAKALAALSGLGEAPLTGLPQLAQALRQSVSLAAQPTPVEMLPPDFARFDDANAGQREQGWLDFLVQDEICRRRERRLRPVRIAAAALLLGAVLLAAAYGVSCIPRAIERRWDAVQMRGTDGDTVTPVQIHIQGKLYRRLFHHAYFTGTVEIGNVPLSKDHTVKTELLAGPNSQQGALFYSGITRDSSGNSAPALESYAVLDMKGDFESVVLRPFEPLLADAGSTSDLIVCAPARTAQEAQALVDELGLRDWLNAVQRGDKQ